jgi:hypothetical protein
MGGIKSVPFSLWGEESGPEQYNKAMRDTGVFPASKREDWNV